MMALTRVEKERISDCRRKIRSISSSLHQVDREKIPAVSEIEECLDSAEKSLSVTLRSDADQN